MQVVTAAARCAGGVQGGDVLGINTYLMVSATGRQAQLKPGASAMI